ncbi:MAG: SAM-dependent methyltransferase [Rhodospirillaceae bacterium]|nr:SAM-dependent methyltransferase [Rhodospirillaceae bacterium]MBT5666098.1 SAM-dependent methyltransferase [Rhodospirillaceae bacterium]MBT5808980.1 SAM-dependent methyltransferase [Rhodospirillaceae bacterium]
MSYKTSPLTEPVYEYLLKASLREPDALRALREVTERHPHGGMRICPEQGQFMRLLVELTGAKTALEIGVFTGYSTLSVALALPRDGRLIACDRNAEWPAVGQPFWREAGVEDIIDLRIGKAAETLDSLIRDGDSGTFDFAFIDGDKKNYGVYYEQCLTLVRPGGLILIDNVLWDGRLIDPADTERATDAIRTLNDKIHGDERVSMCMLPIGDGLTIIRKRG